MFGTTIFINNLDIATYSFNGFLFGMDDILMTGPVTGTIEVDCTGLISVNGNDVNFTFDSENSQLDLDGFGIFLGDALPWTPY